MTGKVVSLDLEKFSEVHKVVRVLLDLFKQATLVVQTFQQVVMCEKVLPWTTVFISD